MLSEIALAAKLCGNPEQSIGDCACCGGEMYADELPLCADETRCIECQPRGKQTVRQLAAVLRPGDTEGQDEGVYRRWLFAELAADADLD